jgi:dihydrofolate reductase
MRKIIVANLASLDGFIAGPNGEIDWFNVDKEFERYAVDFISTVDTMLYGRVTYQLMAGYWPTASATENDPRIIDAMNSFPKVVFSKTLNKVEWKNARLVKDDIGGEISRLKQQPGKNMVIYGSGTIVSQLSQMGLIDEYRIFVSPIILGNGRQQFENIDHKLDLKLLETKTFGTGMVLLHYVAASQKQSN